MEQALAILDGDVDAPFPELKIDRIALADDGEAELDDETVEQFSPKEWRSIGTFAFFERPAETMCNPSRCASQSTSFVQPHRPGRRRIREVEWVICALEIPTPFKRQRGARWIR